MTKAELIENISRSRELPSDLTKKDVALILDMAFGELAQYFSRTKVGRTAHPRFSWPGFGTFTKKRRRPRKGIHPRTLEPLEIEACFTLDFKPASSLKKEMNAPQPAKMGKSGASGASETAETELPPAPMRRTDPVPPGSRKTRRAR